MGEVSLQGAAQPLKGVVVRGGMERGGASSANGRTRERDLLLCAFRGRVDGDNHRVTEQSGTCRPGANGEKLPFAKRPEAVPCLVAFRSEAQARRRVSPSGDEIGVPWYACLMAHHIQRSSRGMTLASTRSFQPPIRRALFGSSPAAGPSNDHQRDNKGHQKAIPPTANRLGAKAPFRTRGRARSISKRQRRVSAMSPSPSPMGAISEVTRQRRFTFTGVSATGRVVQVTPCRMGGPASSALGGAPLPCRWRTGLVWCLSHSCGLLYEVQRKVVGHASGRCAEWASRGRVSVFARRSGKGRGR